MHRLHDSAAVTPTDDRSGDVSHDSELTNTELLIRAFCDAISARAAGLLIGPNIDDVAFARAQRRARQIDTAYCRCVVMDEVA